jgi:tRNA nucleotidyltransferase/poly(A) polymerase
VHSRVSAIKNHRLYPEFLKIRKRLKSHQFVCWLAGGAVRDLLLDKELSDFDLVSDASTEVLKALFPEAVLVGEAFGVLKIPVPSGDTIDLATFREEADYKDRRRPSMVRSSTPVQDSLRRDFTVNSFFWDDEAETVRDYEGGLGDLELKILRCVGDAKTRFDEDFLRIVRLMRFSLQLNFSIAPETLEAARNGLANVEKVSGERIWAELKKLEVHEAWPRGAASDFFYEVMAFILKDEQIKPSNLSAVKSKISTPLALYLLNPAHDYSPILKTRMKVSGRELERYRNIRFLAGELSQLPVEELTFELERSEELFSVFREMILAGIFQENLLERVEQLRAEHPAVLVSGSEMKDLVPPRQISEEIRKIRVGQLGKIFRTKVDALDYLKKKYA